MLYGLSAIALLMFGTYLGKQFEQLIFHHSVGIIAALLGPFCCYLYYLYLRNRSWVSWTGLKPILTIAVAFVK